MATKDEILESIANMTVLEVSELIKAMEEKFGVTAAAPVAAVAVAGPAAGAAAAGGADEKTEFDVVLTAFDESKKIPVIKVVREITGLGLAEAKAFVEAGGKAVKEGVSKEEAESIKAKLAEAGATAELK